MYDKFQGIYIWFLLCPGFVKIEKKYRDISSKRAWSGFILSAITVVIFGMQLSYIGKDLALLSGIKENFILAFLTEAKIPDFGISIPGYSLL